MANRSLHGVLSASIALMLNACVHDGSDRADLMSFETQADALLEAASSDYPGLSATLFVGGTEMWVGAVGLASRETDEPATADTRYNIYSTSKALTGFAFARLISQNRISLADQVGDIAPDLPSQFHAISVEDILSHRSGIRHYGSSQEWIAFAERRCEGPMDAIEAFAEDPILFQPGTDELYSTYAFVLASELLIRITGANDFEGALNSVLAPAAEFTLDRDGASKAQPYIRAGRLPDPPPVPENELVPLPALNAECKFGGGGVVASARELARAGSAFASGEIVPLSQLDELLSHESGIRFGGAVDMFETDAGLVRRYKLSGGAPGGRSYLMVLVEPQISIAVTGNVEGPDLGPVAEAIVSAWLSQGP